MKKKSTAIVVIGESKPTIDLSDRVKRFEEARKKKKKKREPEWAANNFGSGKRCKSLAKRKGSGQWPRPSTRFSNSARTRIKLPLTSGP